MKSEDLMLWWLRSLREYTGNKSHYMRLDKGEGFENRCYSPLGLLCEAYLDLGGDLSIVTEERCGEIHYWYRNTGEEGPKSDADFRPPRCVAVSLERKRPWSIVSFVLTATLTDLFSYPQIADMIELWFSGEEK